MRRYRAGVGFVMDVASRCTQLDRNQKVRLLYACEVIERRTKRPGGRNGLFGIPAMTVLRALLLRFHGRQGLCVPSYDALQRVTGLCRASVARALARLEDAGVIQITRRLVRYADELGVVCVRQGSNIYGFAMPAARIDMGPVNSPLQIRPFPRVHRIAAINKPMQTIPPFERAICGAIKRASRGQAENAVAIEVLRLFRASRGNQ